MASDCISIRTLNENASLFFSLCVIKCLTASSKHLKQHSLKRQRRMGNRSLIKEGGKKNNKKKSVCSTRLQKFTAEKCCSGMFLGRSPNAAFIMLNAVKGRVCTDITEKHEECLYSASLLCLHQFLFYSSFFFMMRLLLSVAAV